jgi:protein Mpv17
MNKDNNNNNNNKMNFLSVRGGANHNRGALSAVMVEALSIVNNFYQTSPYVAAALTCGTKACAADYVAQKRAPASGNIDAARTIAFLVYGAIYQGMAQEFIYNHLYPLWFGTESTVAVVLKKVFFDLLIQTTLVTLPIAYLTKAAIYRHSPQQGLGRYWHDIWENGLLTKYFLLWGPVQCITFSIVPEHLRVSFIAVVSFFWLIVLSTVSARPQGNNNTEKVSVPRETVLPEDSSLVNER